MITVQVKLHNVKHNPDMLVDGGDGRRCLEVDDNCTIKRAMHMLEVPPVTGYVLTLNKKNTEDMDIGLCDGDTLAIYKLHAGG